MSAPLGRLRLSPPSIQRLKRLALAATGVMAVMLVLIIGLAVAIDRGALNNAVARFASAKLGRPVTFAHLETRLLTRRPQLEVRGLTVGPEAGGAGPDLLKAERVMARFPWPGPLFGRTTPSELEVSGADLKLVPPLKRGQTKNVGDPLRGIRRLRVLDSRFSLEDRSHGISLAGRIMHDASANGRWPLQLSASGTIRGGAVSLTAAGGALNGRRGGQTYPMTARLQDGAVKIEASGALDRPFSLRGFDLSVRAEGPNLVALEYLLDLGTPNSTPFVVSGRIQRRGEATRASGLVARIGQSDFKGTIISDASSGRRLITIDLASDTLHAHDIASFLSSRPPHAVARVTAGGTAARRSRLFSETPLNLSRFNLRDAVLRIRARRLVTGVIAPARLAADGRLKDGVFRLDPVVITPPSGRLRAAYTLDVRKPDVGMALDLNLSGARIDVVVPELARTMDGTAGARLSVHGAGRSILGIVSDAKGTAHVQVVQGDLKRPAAKLLSGALAEAAFAALASKDARTPLACARADVRIGGGRAEVANALMVTDAGSTTAYGGFDLVHETADIRFAGRPRRFTLFKDSRPAAIQGPLTDLKVVVRPKSSGEAAPVPPKAASAACG